MYDINIKIEFQMFQENDLDQNLKKLETQFRGELQDFMNQLEIGNGKVNEFTITKKSY
ncbi:MAG: hypothetical protein R2685_15325 [Candidatus Nitrosocosmicus sp.]|nr:hypothetical protein [Candidatus Nitrosocosmicus sp.]